LSEGAGGVEESGKQREGNRQTRAHAPLSIADDGRANRVEKVERY
jgi:hypothetical protein